MHGLTDAVAAHFAHHAVAPVFAVGLHRIRYIADTAADFCGAYTGIERFLGGAAQIEHFLVHFADSESVARVWTCRTRDRKPSAHYEHTIAMVDDEPQVLTTFDYISEALQDRFI